MIYKGYEAVIGIEIHAELKTESKIFCSCPTRFGSEPNTQTCPVCMGLPGSMPTLNRRAVELAVVAGKVFNCTVNKYSKADRKNYFYPDLPKAFQISQYDRPICENGWLDVECDGVSKRIGITRIHIEEDAGKLLHEGERTYIDYNRCGVPLIEIVTESDIRDGKDAVAFLSVLRKNLLFAGVSACRMNEGNLRFDVNLSVRKEGDTLLYTRTEIKNLNSFANVERAIELEHIRQVDIVESGGSIEQGTLRYDEERDCIVFMRKKEDSHGYRFFPEPDLLPIVLSEDDIRRICADIPKMPDERMREYEGKYAITSNDAEILTSSPDVSDYFERAAKLSRSPKYTANLIIGELLRRVDGSPFAAFSPEHMAQLSDMADGGEINSSIAKKLTGELIYTGISPREYAKEHNMLVLRDKGVIASLVREAISENPRSVSDYKNGKNNARKAIFGAVMKKSGGNADPMTVDKLLQSELDKM